MNEIWAGIQEAFRLIIILDADLIEITLRSSEVSLTALVDGLCIGSSIWHLAGNSEISLSSLSRLQRSTR